jgi:iron complex outermembrane recepter protein
MKMKIVSRARLLIATVLKVAGIFSIQSARARIALACASATIISLGAPIGAHAQSAKQNAASTTAPASQKDENLGPPNLMLAQSDSPSSRDSGQPSQSPSENTQNSKNQSTASSPSSEGKDREKLEELVVTSTRVVRDGYQSPTPTTVIGADAIAAAAQPNIANFVNELPSLVGSATPATQVEYSSNGTNGINALNLRNLGQNRTLVLLDGQRVGAATTTGWVDINTFPQALVKRIDVVTGGASADWGSDAVAGVVNFVLDKDFTGVKGEASAGVSTYKDDPNGTLSFAAGAPFADGSGHVLVSVEAAADEGLRGLHRPWFDGTKAVPNPNYTLTNGQPSLLVLPNVGFIAGYGTTPGGIIMSGPLTGTYFGPAGTIEKLNWPNQSSSHGTFIQGGQWLYTDVTVNADLVPKTERGNIFLRTSYDVTSNVQVFGQFSYGTASSRVNTGSNWEGAGYNPAIQPDNAFIPASIASQITSPIAFGTLNQDLGLQVIVSKRQAYRGVVGANGDFDALGSNWTWNVYGQATENDVFVSTEHMVNNGNYANAIDAVRDPATGTIVCRSTLTHPTNGCIPYNLFGIGVNGTAAINYVSGASWENMYLKENVVSATLNGNPIQDWAGPISVAAGVEHRNESMHGTNDPLSLQYAWYQGNYHASVNGGGYSVTEGFFETVVPLAKDLPFAKSLDFNGAVRETDYNLAGTVTTFKVGATWQPINDISFRASQSHDIRAPNLAELFTAGSSSTVQVTDPANNNVPSVGFEIQSSNRNLKPEVSDTTAFGVVLQPRFLPGFQASVDYFKINLSQEIIVLGAQTIINECFTGYTALCPDVIRNGSGQITQIDVKPVNFASQVESGIDFEASYRRPFLNGNLTLRVLATNYLNDTFNNGFTQPINNVGANQGDGCCGDTSLPKWRYFATARWDNELFSAQLTARGFSAGVLYPPYIQCASNCPVQTAVQAANNPTISDNHAPGALYFDTNFTYKLPFKTEGSVFLTIDNIANKPPADIAQPFAPGAAVNTNPTLYDILGRTYRLGVRFRM